MSGCKFFVKISEYFIVVTIIYNNPFILYQFNVIKVTFKKFKMYEVD